MEGTQVIRAFRVFRASRLIARVETLRNLVLAIFMVIPKMNAIFMLLGLIFFIFGVMFTTLFKGMFLEGMLTWPYFETLYGSFFTLFQIMTLVSRVCIYIIVYECGVGNTIFDVILTMLCHCL